MLSLREKVFPCFPPFSSSAAPQNWGQKAFRIESERVGCATRESSHFPGTFKAVFLHVTTKGKSNKFTFGRFSLRPRPGNSALVSIHSFRRLFNGSRKLFFRSPQTSRVRNNFHLSLYSSRVGLDECEWKGRKKSFHLPLVPFGPRDELR